MSLRSWMDANPRAISIWRMAGICIFVLAFFLPAVRDVSSSPFGKSDVLFKGWECARIALGATPGLFTRSDPDTPFYIPPLLAMSGWLNLLILLYLAFIFAPKFVWLRRILAVAVLACMAATWTIFAMIHLLPLIGHYLWIAGALMILAPELACYKRCLHTNDKQVAPNP